MLWSLWMIYILFAEKFQYKINTYLLFSTFIIFVVDLS